MGRDGDTDVSGASEYGSHELDGPPWLRVESTLMATARQIRISYDQAFEPLDLNLSQASLLAFVEEFGPHTQTSLAERMALGRASTGTMIDQLQDRELIQRQPDPEDRRVWLVSITARGKEVVAQILEIDAVFRNALRKDISRSERQNLANTLVRIQQNLHSITHPTQNP